MLIMVNKEKERKQLKQYADIILYKQVTNKTER